ncbi:MAG: glutamate synthase large subunit, partial [Stellaceae bacterium]
FKGTGGQTFGGFLARGIAFTLEGATNDYAGKGLSGGRLVVYPPDDSKLARDKSIIVGNTVLYGAISGECYFSGVAGERFAVRNSGAIAVIEGAGAHCCEYMTGGIVAVLGDTGLNFAAGMSGGVAYVLDERGDFKTRCNTAMVELESLQGEDGPVDADQPIAFAYSLHENDIRLLRRMIERHARLTQSPRARMILENWTHWQNQFVKVMPVEYRRALQKIEQAQKAAPAAIGVAVSA